MIGYFKLADKIIFFHPLFYSIPSNPCYRLLYTNKPVTARKLKVYGSDKAEIVTVLIDFGII